MISYNDTLAYYDSYVNEYLVYLIANNAKKSTIELYKIVFESFREYLCTLDVKMLSEIKLVHYNQYILRLKAKKLKDTSIYTYINIIKSLFGYITQNNEENTDYTKILDNIKFKPTIQKNINKEKYLNNAELEKIKIYLHNLDITNKNNAKSSLLLKFGYYLGLRISESLSLCFGAIKLSRYDDKYVVRVINIKSKDHAYKELFISKKLIEDELYVLKKFLTRNQMYSDDSYIFFNNDDLGSSFSRQYAHKKLTKIYKQLNINKSGTHILRHTSAKKMVESGVPLPNVQKHLGHAKIDTTMIYASVDDDSMAKASEKL